MYDILNRIALNLILVCHVLIILFFILVPFFGNNYLLLFHVIVLPFVVLHWVVNDNTCFLSTMEVYIRKQLKMEVDKNNCFTCMLVNPIYNFVSDFNKWSAIIYAITFCLWLISVYKLLNGFVTKKINNFNELLLGDINGYISSLTC